MQKMNNSPSLSNGFNPSASESSTARRVRTRRYGSPSRTDSDEEGGGGGGNRLRSSQRRDYSAAAGEVPPIPLIYTSPKLEDEYDPYRPKDSEDEEDQDASIATGSSEPHTPSDSAQTPRAPLSQRSSALLDMPMSRKQFNRISGVLNDIEEELTKTHHRVEPGHDHQQQQQYDRRLLNGSAETDLDEDGELEQQIRQHRNQYNPYHDYDHSHSEGEEAEYLSNGGGVDADDDAAGHDVDRTFHSSTSASSGSEYHRQHSSKAPFHYDDTEEIDPPLARLPSHTQSLHAQSMSPSYSSSSSSPEFGDNKDIHQLLHPSPTKPRIELSQSPALEPYAGMRSGGSSSEHDDSSRPTSTQNSVSTAMADAWKDSRQQQTPSTSTLDVLITENGRNLSPFLNHRESCGDGSAKPASSPGLAYLDTTPPTASTSNFVPPAQPLETSSPVSSSPQSQAVAGEIPIPDNAQSKSSQIGMHAKQSSVSSILRPPPLSAFDSGLRRPNGWNRNSPSHTRNNSASSASTSGPPLSPPPSCGLPPLPSSTSSQSLASLQQVALQQNYGQRQTAQHTRMASIDSAVSAEDVGRETPESDTVMPGKSPASNLLNHTGQEHDGSVFARTEAKPVHANGVNELEQETSAFPFPQEEARQNTADSDSDRRFSALSNGSSWRGGGDRTLSSATTEFDLSFLPTSPSKATHKMNGITEDSDEEHHDPSAIDTQTQRDEYAAQYLEEHVPGLDMEDLRAIQDRLVRNAMMQQNGNLATQGTDESHRHNDQIAVNDDTIDKDSPSARLIGSPHHSRSSPNSGSEQGVNADALAETRASPECETVLDTYRPTSRDSLALPASDKTGILQLGSPFEDQRAFVGSGDLNTGAAPMDHVLQSEGA